MSPSPEQFRPKEDKSYKANLEEGLKLYKTSVRDFIKKCVMINLKTRESVKKKGLEYHGFLDWNKEDYEWKQEVEQDLHHVARTLRLTGAEVDAIWEEVKRGKIK